MTQAVYVGRFQPFAKHHRSVVEFIDEQPDIEEIIIVKGGIQWSDQNLDPHDSPSRNPFTFDECCKMIELSLNGRIQKPYRILGVADTKTRMSDPFWVEWVKGVITAVGTKEFVVYINESRIKQAFERAAIECRPFVIKHPGLRATIVREHLAFGTKEQWLEELDPEVVDYLIEIKGPERVRWLLEEK